MRLFVFRRLGRNWRAGASFDPRELSQRRRGRTLASPTIARRPVSFYGVTLTDADPSAAPPHARHSVWRNLWVIASTAAWLIGRAIFWTVIVAAIVLCWGIVLMSALVRVL